MHPSRQSPTRSASTLRLCLALFMTVCTSLVQQTASLGQLDNPNQPPRPGTQGTAGSPLPGAQGGPGGAAMVGRILGGATFMLIIDRPYEAEKLYRLLLKMDPKNQAAIDGLREAKRSERPTFTALFHNYRDTIENRLVTYGGGPTFRTPYGRITLLAGNGYFGQNIHSNKPNQTFGFLASDLEAHNLGKSTLNLILEPYSGKFEGYAFINRTFYNGAPSRTLFNFKASYVPVPGRERFSLGYSRNDSFVQNDQLQFFAPETFFAVVSGLTNDITTASADYPIDRKIDSSFTYQYLSYSDGNTRNIMRSQVMYRLLPKSNMPVPIMRIGLQHIYDDTKHFGVYYYTPQDQQYLSLASDFLILAPKFKFGLFGTLPVAKQRGRLDGKYDPDATLYAFANYNIFEGTSVYVKMTAAKKTGFSAAFTDIVLGVDKRF